MEIEVIDFYPLERNEEKEYLTGMLRIKLPDIGIHLLGIFVSKNKNRWRFSLPGKIGTHHETGESVRYPLITFEDRDKQKELMTAIHEEAPVFIERRISDKENPLIFPEKSQKREANKKQKQVDKLEQTNDHVKVNEETASKTKTKSVANKTTIKGNPNPVVEEKASALSPAIMQSIASKQWIDPPKKKSYKKSVK